jgi:hypothetical protein
VNFHPLKRTILLLFIPLIIIIIIPISGLSSYWLAVNQIEDNTYRNISDTVSQTKSQLNERLVAVLIRCMLTLTTEGFCMRKRIICRRAATIRTPLTAAGRDEDGCGV